MTPSECRKVTIGVAGDPDVADNVICLCDTIVMKIPISPSIEPSVVRTVDGHDLVAMARPRAVAAVRQTTRDAPSKGRIVTVVASLTIAIVWLGALVPATTFAQSATAAERLQNAGVATVNELNALERKHQAEIERLNQLSNDAMTNLQYKIEQLERRLSRIEKARQLEERRAEESSFEKSRMLNWPKASSGMNRREIYRLIGSGVKDRTETSRDCRCYSQGKICFTDEDLAEKSNVRCQL